LSRGRAHECACLVASRLPDAITAGEGLSVGSGPGRIEFLRRSASRNLKLLAILYDDSGMAAALGDIANDGNNLAA
jgi:hypothetical protein